MQTSLQREGRISIQTRTSHPIINVGLILSSVSTQTLWLTKSCSNSNAELNQLRVPVQTRSSAKLVFHLKCRAQPDSRLNVNAELSHTRNSIQTRACKLYVLTIE